VDSVDQYQTQPTEVEEACPCDPQVLASGVRELGTFAHGVFKAVPPDASRVGDLLGRISRLECCRDAGASTDVSRWLEALRRRASGGWTLSA
jgi:hypothetical protein